MMKYWFLLYVVPGLGGGPVTVPGGYMTATLCERAIIEAGIPDRWMPRCIPSELPRRN